MKESNIFSKIKNQEDYLLAYEIIKKIEEKGFECWFAGGCVRDALLNRDVSDFDLATNALPNDILDIFGESNCLSHASEFGTITVKSKKSLFEITSFRSDLGIKDNRRPEKIVFSTKEEDVKRRDFTINGLLFNPKRGLLDLVGGLNDLNKKVLRAIGDPNERFKEDALRILRLYRFSINLGFKIEEETLSSSIKQKKLLHNISKERVFDEIRKLNSKGINLKFLNIILRAYEYPEIKSKTFDFNLRSESMLPFRAAFLNQKLNNFELKDFILKKNIANEFNFFNSLMNFLEENKIDQAKEFFIFKKRSLNYEFQDIKKIWKSLSDLYNENKELDIIFNKIESLKSSDYEKFKTQMLDVKKRYKDKELGEKLKHLEANFYF